MNSTKKITQKTSGTHKKYKPGQLVTINHRVLGLSIKPIKNIRVELHRP